MSAETLSYIRSRSCRDECRLSEVTEWSIHSLSPGFTYKVGNQLDGVDWGVPRLHTERKVRDEFKIQILFLFTDNSNIWWFTTLLNNIPYFMIKFIYFHILHFISFRDSTWTPKDLLTFSSIYKLRFLGRRFYTFKLLVLTCNFFSFIYCL